MDIKDYFALKVECAICGKPTGLNRHKTKDDKWVCPRCYKEKLKFRDKAYKLTADEVKNMGEFKATKKINNFIEIDDINKKILINKKIYNYNEIIDFELLEDGESIAKGGLGRALVGGALFGGVGAIVGGITGGKKSKPICNSLKVKITINDINNPTVYVNFINTSTKKSSIIYRTEFDLAQKCLSTLQLIVNGNQEVKETPIGSDADEILKFKNLLDQGIISQEEFEAKKKQLLGI